MEGNCQVAAVASPVSCAWRKYSGGTGASVSRTRSAPSIWAASRSSARLTRSDKKPTLVTAATATITASPSKRRSPARVSRQTCRKAIFSIFKLRRFQVNMAASFWPAVRQRHGQQFQSACPARVYVMIYPMIVHRRIELAARLPCIAPTPAARTAIFAEGDPAHPAGGRLPIPPAPQWAGAARWPWG